MNIKITVTHVTIYDRQLKEELTLTVAGRLTQRTCKDALNTQQLYVDHKHDKLTYEIAPTELYKFLADHATQVQ